MSDFWTHYCLRGEPIKKFWRKPIEVEICSLGQIEVFFLEWVIFWHSTAWDVSQTKSSLEKLAICPLVHVLPSLQAILPIVHLLSFLHAKFHAIYWMYCNIDIKVDLYGASIAIAACKMVPVAWISISTCTLLAEAVSAWLMQSAACGSFASQFAQCAAEAYDR